MTQQANAPAPSQSTKAAPGTPAIVDVYADPDGTGGASFSHEWRWQDGGSQGKGAIDVPKRAATDPGPPIHFNLNDKSGLGVRFSDDDLGAIWVSRSGCPTAKCSDGEIPETKIQRSPNLLKVYNENSEESISEPA